MCSRTAREPDERVATGEREPAREARHLGHVLAGTGLGIDGHERAAPGLEHPEATVVPAR